ncbi:MAG TPA: hypothetical protein VF739_16095 [Ktedonobacterales bacterium]
MPVSDTAVQPPLPGLPEPHLSAIVPVDPRGRHELLRLAAALAPSLQGPMGNFITASIATLGIAPAHVDRVVATLPDSGSIALVDDTLVTLGRRLFLETIGVRLNRADLRAAERIEADGDLAYFVVAVARAHCLGVIGAPDLRPTSIERRMK